MTEWAVQYGYTGLFVLSFLAATLIAAPSDVLAMAMPPLGFDPLTVALVATLGGTLGNLMNYGLGRYGARFLLARWLQGDETAWKTRAEHIYRRYGVFSLLLTGLPFIGDPLTFVAGVFRVNVVVFTLLVVVAKLLKFAVLLGAVGGVTRLV